MTEKESDTDRFGLLDYAPVGICITDRKYNVRFWNRCIEDWTGISKKNILSGYLPDFFPNLDTPKYRRRLDIIFEGGPPAIFSSQLHQYVFPCPLPGRGFRIQHTTVTGIPSESENEYDALWAVTDVTELTRQIRNTREMKNKVMVELERRKKTEEGLRKANRKILEQQKAVIEEERLKVLLQVAGATANQLEQPLQTLLDNVERMDADARLPEKIAKYREGIRNSGRRIMEIIGRIQQLHDDEIQKNVPFCESDGLPEGMKILIVVPDSEGCKKISCTLENIGKPDLLKASGIRSALRILEKHSIDLIVIDHLLDDGDGFAFLSMVKQKGIETPVMVVTAHGNEMVASRLIQEGAFDYLPMSELNSLSFIHAINRSLDKARLKSDIKTARSKIVEMAKCDGLTGLFNRRYFNEALEAEIARAKKHGSELVLCMMDLDHFKKVNDKYGHITGDHVLRETGRCLKNTFREHDLICRYGGEEFAVIMPRTSLENALSACERFRETIASIPFNQGGNSFHITISAGLAKCDFPFSATSLDLVAQADKALYQAKENGRNRISYF